ncbi:MAG: hypothetical protein Q4G00_14695 [Clostridia bacterium]|nr:hypothetical protein [Clostridia bacterium]
MAAAVCRVFFRFRSAFFALMKLPSHIMPKPMAITGTAMRRLSILKSSISMKTPMAAKPVPNILQNDAKMEFL